MFLYSHPQTAGSLLAVVGCLSLTVNLFILYKVICDNVFSRSCKSFGRIWICRGFAYVSLGAFFAFFVPLICFIDVELLKTRWARSFAHMMMFFTVFEIYSNFLIAINRYVIISRPLQYSYVFCGTKTLLMILAVFLIALACDISNVIDPCHQTPLDSDMSFVQLPYGCSVWINVFDLVIPFLPLTMTIVIDLMAIHSIRVSVGVRKTLTTTQPSARKELRLCCMILVQAVISVYVFLSLSFAAFLENEFLEFLASTFTWALVQVVDGLVVILFNTEMRSGLKKMSSNSSSKAIVDSEASL